MSDIEKLKEDPKALQNSTDQKIQSCYYDKEKEDWVDMADIEKLKEDPKAKTGPEQAKAPQNISVQEILSTYPVDREKCRDVLLVEISTNLRRIADSLEAIPQALLLMNKEIQSIKK